MIIKEQWRRALDETVDDLLERVEPQGPPVDAIRLAARLGIRVAVDGSQRVRGRRKRIVGQSSIFLRPEDRPERLQWAAAHELGEEFAWKVFEAADWRGTEIPDRLREQVANLFASRLLLPSATFADDCRRLDFDLVALKGIYTTASHELIARRMLDLVPEAILTIVDQEGVTMRANGFGQRAPAMRADEKDCWTWAHSAGSPQTEETSSLTIRAWPVHEPGWKREILLTSPRGEWLAEEPTEAPEPVEC